MSTIYNAKELRNQREEKIKQLVEKLPKSKSTPCLAIIQVGNIAESNKYVGNKIKALDRVGMKYMRINASEQTDDKELYSVIKMLNQDPNVHGIMIQLPSPKHLSTQFLLDAIAPEKDVDGLSTHSMGQLAIPNSKETFVPCTALGVKHILIDMGHGEGSTLNVRGKNVVVIGKGVTSGLPITLLMMKNGANVVNLSSGCSEVDRINYLSKADIVISCAGVPNIVNPTYVPTKATLVNVGMSVNDEGKIVGDYDPHYAEELGIKCTSVVGSTGIMTVQSLLENVIQAYVYQN